MSFYNYNDIKLDNKLTELKECMQEVLDLIGVCDSDTSSEFYTMDLKKAIQRFLTDF